MQKLNLNSSIKVKLTPLGADIFYNRYDELNQKIKENGGLPLEPRMPIIDKDGFSTFQLWDFINLYGKYFVLGMRESDKVIKDLNIYIEEKELEIY